MRNIVSFCLPFIAVLVFTFMSCNAPNSSSDENVKDEDSTSVLNGENEDNVNKNSLAVDMVAGESVYQKTCLVCHMADGKGIPGHYPPLADADYLKEDKMVAIKVTIFGVKEPIKVEGIDYSGGKMTLVELDDEQVKSVVNYILNSWGNKIGVVSLEDVKSVRENSK